MKLSSAQLRQIIRETIEEARGVDDTAGMATLVASAIADMIEANGQELLDRVLGSVSDTYAPARAEDIEHWADQVAERALKESSFMKDIIAHVVRQVALAMQGG